MEELSTLLIVFGYGAGAGTFCALVLALLFAIFLNTRKGKEDDNEEALVIPYSALTGGAMGGGAPQAMSIADVMRMRAAMGTDGGGDGDKKDDKKDNKPGLGGTYI